MKEFLLFACAVAGLTHIMVDSAIMSPIRSLARRLLPAPIYEVFECYQCMGTWCGFICGYLVFGFDVPTILISGFAGSFIAMLSADIIARLEGEGGEDGGTEL